MESGERGVKKQLTLFAGERVSLLLNTSSKTISNKSVLKKLANHYIMKCVGAIRFSFAFAVTG